jgi:hypothetical protein
LSKLFSIVVLFSLKATSSSSVLIVDLKLVHHESMLSSQDFDQHMLLILWERGGGYLVRELLDVEIE